MIQENKSATLSCNNDQTLFEPKVYGICSNDSNSMKSDNPNSGIYAADTSRTIDCGGVNRHLIKEVWLLLHYRVQ